jgi:hypothetical protein
MNDNQVPCRERGRLENWLRGVAALVVLSLGILGGLFVFDFLEINQLKIYIVRVVLAAGLLAFVGAVLAVLLGRGPRR